MGKLSPKIIGAIIRSKCSEDQIVSAIEGAGSETQQDEARRKRNTYKRRDLRAEDTRDMTSENSE